jgi:acyl-coenzyme A thioesterase PaaI-like protein
MKKDKKTVRTARGIKKYTYLGCPLTRNRSAWCYRLCTPNVNGRGRCGRIAPHSMKSRIQLGIEAHNKKLAAAHYEKLERDYLSAPCNKYFDAGIRVFEGNADIVIPIRKKFLDATGSVHSSFCYQAMSDAALYSVNSLVRHGTVVPTHFSAVLTRSVDAGEVVARGRFVGTSEAHYLAEAVLTDPEGEEIAHGTAVFEIREAPLTKDGTQGAMKSASSAKKGARRLSPQARAPSRGRASRRRQT